MKLRPDLSAAEHWIYPLNGPKRDYQYDIVRKCLFDNTIVALPTAQGKAFIAGVVMLNFYRWFPDGKVVFVAPTKTLIANQIKACQKTGGFQDIDAVELTRANRRETRTRAWKEKRVLYMTPQIFNNDLLFGTYDAEDIILLVFDEAHKATGHYAYDKAVQFMMAKNRHFRVLALTANPGADREAVQALIDVLHISRIESRNEGSRSPDSKIYIQDENVEQHIVAMTEHVDRINDPLSRLIESVLRPLQQQNMIDRSIDAASLHSFTAEAKLQSLKTGEGEGCLKPNEGWAIRALATLSYLARAKSCLIQGTIGMCNTVIHALKRDADNEGNFSNRRQLRDDPLFKEVITELEVQGREGFSMHPKMKCMKALVLQHFAQQHRKNEPTNVMVFVAFREAVDQIAAVEEIVHVLSSERPRIRPHQFVGQGTSDSGGTGPAETEQMAILRRFRSDELNVLVATSIGEELSDIGDVGLIVCYDAQETPRILQSLGLTGRRYDGTIHILISAAREKCDMDEAQRSHKDVQKAIVCGDQFEFYGDVERLLPDHIEPQCLEMKLEIEERVRSRGRKNRPKGTKRNRNDGASSTTPDSPVSRYRSVSTPRVLRGTNKRLKVARDWEQAGRDDETDIEIQSGLIFPPAHAAPPTVLDAAMSLQRTADETHLSIVEIDSDSAPSTFHDSIFPLINDLNTMQVLLLPPIVTHTPVRSYWVWTMTGKLKSLILRWIGFLVPLHQL
ncbi:P-loop containing nucleoside triphosphate hydrolase protein [Mycena vitilis]|nr:P-loop containing nucleoside triphosphate hydrolase protein [Mycena vitilis]